MGLCKAMIIGNLGQDPTVRYTPDGLAVTNFSVAATEKVKGEQKTQWVKVTTFGKLAEICGEYLQKGKQVYIEGRMQTSEWEGQDGRRHFDLEVIASTMQMLSGNNSQERIGSGESSTEPQKEDERDIPF